MLRAELSARRVHMMTFVVFAAIGAWGLRHIVGTVQAGSLWSYLYSHWVFLFSFLMMLITLILAYREKPRQAPVSATDNEYVTAVVPAYNEDPEILRDCLRSLAVQTRPFQEVCVVDDGSNKVDYTEVREWFEGLCAAQNVYLRWQRRANGGKREAQATGFRAARDTTVFVTVDSDSVLDPHALEELLKPLADPDVQSVAGVVLARNNRTNLLARITDLLFVTGQLIDRSMMSSLGSVLVNSGGLAAYRADIVWDHLDAYLDERFFGRHIKFSDDSMLTLYSLNRGKTVQQPTAFVFAMMPDKMSHHVRQQVRWMKGSFIRSWWRLKYLPVTSFGFFRQAFGWAQFVVTTLMLGIFFIVRPAATKTFAPYLLLIPLVLGYAQALRYFAVKRSDESFLSQFATYALAPLAVLWSYFIIRPIRIYATFTCFNSSWGTRQSVEVTLDGQTHPWWKPQRLLLVWETEYERALRMVVAASAEQDAYAAWVAYYRQLTDKQKFALWLSYETAVKRYEKFSKRTGRKLVLKTPFGQHLPAYTPA